MNKLYTVVIVDDEATISEGLSRLVKWNDVGFNVIATFSNGLDRDVFRLYYTSECEDQQTIDVYFEDNHDQLYQLTFTFNNEAKEEEDTTEGNTITPIGTIVSPININP